MGYEPVVDSNNVVTQFTIPASQTTVEYFRLNCSYIGADSVITVDEEIV